MRDGRVTGLVILQFENEIRPGEKRAVHRPRLGVVHSVSVLQVHCLRTYEFEKSKQIKEKEVVNNTPYSEMYAW
jgi:hypothetical protein